MSLDRLVAALDQRIGRVWWGEPDTAAIARTAAEIEHRGFTLPPQLAALWARRNGFVLGKPHPSLPRDPIVAPGELPGVFDAAGGVLFVGAGDDALFSYFEDPQTAGHLVLGAISDIELLTLAPSDGGVFLADLERLDDGPLRLASSLDELFASWCDADLQLGEIVERAQRATAQPPRIAVYRGARTYVQVRKGEAEFRCRIALTAGASLELAIVDATRPTAITVEIESHATLTVTDRAPVAFEPPASGDYVLQVRGPAPVTLALRVL